MNSGGVMAVASLAGKQARVAVLECTGWTH